MAVAHAHHGATLQVRSVAVHHTAMVTVEGKGHDVEFSDFLEHEGVYDRIVMNPPFEKGADIDHVINHQGV